MSLFFVPRAQHAEHRVACICCVLARLWLIPLCAVSVIVATVLKNGGGIAAFLGLFAASSASVASRDHPTNRQLVALG
jgi:disulfide bond formation protein DsbB